MRLDKALEKTLNEQMRGLPRLIKYHYPPRGTMIFNLRVKKNSCAWHKNQILIFRKNTI
jgi:uncharacterized membrane protein (UPF0127 family)